MHTTKQKFVNQYATEWLKYLPNTRSFSLYGKCISMQSTSIGRVYMYHNGI